MLILSGDDIKKQTMDRLKWSKKNQGDSYTVDGYYITCMRAHS